MISVDKNTILNSTFDKRMKRGYESLKSSYTQENASGFRSVYEDAKLSEILDNSEYIFPEPYYGYDFYKHIMESAKISPARLRREADKIHSYMNDHMKEMDEPQKAMYESLVELVDSRVEKSKGRLVVEARLVTENVTNDETLDYFYDALYKEETNDIFHMIYDMENAEEVLFFGLESVGVDSDIATLMHGRLEKALSAKQYSMEVPNIINATKRMFKDSEVLESVREQRNPSLSTLLYGIAEENQNSHLASFLTESGEDFDPIYASPDLSVNRIFEDDDYAEMLESRYEEEYNDRTGAARMLYESALEYAMVELGESRNPNEDISTSDLVPAGTSVYEATLILGEAVDRFSLPYNERPTSFFEFTNNGEATKVINREAGKSGSDKAMVDKKKKDDTDDDDDEDHHTVEKKDQKKSKKDDYPDFDSDDDDDIDEDDEDEKKDDKDDKKPVKPKQSLTSKVTQAGMDADAQFQKTRGGAARGLQKVANAGKAVLKVPNSIINSLKDMGRKFDDMDDNRRKEYIIQPGNRKKIFRAMKTALYYYIPLSMTGGGLAGAIAKAQLMPVLLIIRHYSKDKNKRIRNELAAELDSEIKICEEKISDANSAGNNKAKYELMRIKDKLTAERTRVRANSKYI